MIFIDTNFFLRFLLKDNSNQYSEAKDLFLEAAHGKIEIFTSTLVFFEICWVLRSIYLKDNHSLTNKLKEILTLKCIFTEHSILADSLNLFEKTNLSLEDCYHILYSKNHKAREFKTYDKKLLKSFNEFKS